MICFAENGVGKALFFADVLKQARGHAAAEKVVHDRERVAAGIRHRAGRHADADVDLLELAFGASGESGGRNRRNCGMAVLSGFGVAEARRYEIKKPLVRDIAGSSDDDVVWRVGAAKGGAKGFAIEAADCLRSAEDGAAERMLSPKIAGKHFVDEVFGIVFNHANFFENDGALTIDFVRRKLRIKDHIGENVEDGFQMFVEDASIEAGHFPGSEGIDHAADGIDFAGDCFGSAAACAFEKHVLEKMGNAVELRSFVARAGANPDACGNGTNVGHGFRDDNEAVGQSGLLDGPVLKGHSHSFSQRARR